MKTIAIVINTSWNIYNFRLGLLKELQRTGYRVIAIAPEDSYSKKLVESGIEHHHITINNKGTNPLEELLLVARFYLLYRKLKPDVLLHYTIKPNIYGAFAAWALNIPVISNISGLGTVFLVDKLSSKVARQLYKFALRIPKKVFFQNKDDKALFIDLKLISEDKTRLVPGSGIDTHKFVSSAVEQLERDIPSFLFIARLVKDKGLIEYIDAARQLKKHYPDAQFSILGAFYPGNPSAISRQEMVDWEQEGVIKYLGTTENVMPVIAKTDCVVLPSYREGLSRVLLEAASMAKPIVTTDVPGCRDVVEDEVNGFLCQPRDAEDLANKMEKMILLDKSQRLEMGNKGRQKVVNEFDEKFVINFYKNKIRLILG